MQQHNKIATGISFPKELLKQIDKDRGDIPRSRYITKFLEKRYLLTKKIKTKDITRKKNDINKNKMDSLESRLGDLLSSKPQINRR
jgi:metal-responsive CopG/Arc/MetJ family transcriptional regulator